MLASGNNVCVERMWKYYGIRLNPMVLVDIYRRELHLALSVVMGLRADAHQL